MKVMINQFFTHVGYSYPFTGIFVGWVGQEVGKRAKPLPSFLKIHSLDHTLGFFTDAKPNISAPEIYGPKLHRRDKELQFFIVLPHEGGAASKDPKAYVTPVRLLFESMATALEKANIDSSQIVQDLPDLIQHFVRNARKANYIRVDDE